MLPLPAGNGFFSLLPLGFPVLVRSLFPDGAHEVEFEPGVVGNVGQGGDLKAIKGLESLRGNIREEKWFP